MANDALSALQKKLARQEETNGDTGLISRTPKQMMLDATDVEDANPNYHYRWVNLRDANKVRAREIEGYEIVPSGEGGKKLGSEMVLMRIPRDRYLARVKAQDRLHKQRLAAHTDEMEQVVESVARQLRDRYGMDIPTSRILVNESQ